MPARKAKAPAAQPGQDVHRVLSNDPDDVTGGVHSSQVAPPAACQPLTTLEFFERLYANATGWLVLWTLRDHASKWYEVPGQLPRAAEDAVKLAAAHDVYFGVGLQKDRARRGRGNADSVVFIPAAWVDIDVAGEGHSKGKTYFPSKDAAREFLNGLPIKPTFAIDSGHGLHGYWQLRDPLVLASPGEYAWPIEDREYAVKVLAGWQAFVQSAAKARGHDVDSTAELARVLRVPGTTNHKGDPLPVTVLAADGPTVNASELLEHAPAASVPQPRQAGDIALDPLAGPPGKFVALLDNDRKIKRTWNRARGDLKDPSASGYDLALADGAVTAAWNDQEICNLLVAFRRKHGEDLKRPDYYRTTINKARALAQPQADALAAIEDATSTEDHAGKLARVREVLHLPLARVVERTRANEDAEFALVLDSAEEITVGSGSDLLSQRHVRGIVASSARRVLPHLAPAAWDKLAQLMLDICQVDQLPEDCTEHGEIRIALAQYLDRTTVLRQGPDGAHPFFAEDGRLYFVGSHFREWLKMSRLGDLSGKKFGRIMGLLHITGERVPMRLKGRKPTSRFCWRVPDDLTPESCTRQEP